MWRFLKKLKLRLPPDPAMPLLGVCPKEVKAGTQTVTRIPVFIAALVIIAEGGSDPSVHQWTQTVVCTHNGTTFSLKKGRKF